MATMTPAELAAWKPELDTKVWERFPEVTAANAQEVYPGVGDPLSFDVNLVAIEHGTRTLAERMGLSRTLGLDERDDLAFFAAFYGHVYINISTLRELTKWVPKADPDAIDEQLFGLSRPAGAPAWKPTARHQLMRVRTLIKLLPLVRRMEKDRWANNEAVESYLQKIQAADLESYTDAALMRELDEAYRRNLVTCEIHATATFLCGSSNFEALRTFLQQQGFESVDALVADLCTGLTDVESAKPGRELVRLAQRIRSSNAPRALFGSGDPGHVLEQLRNADTDETRALNRDVEFFLRTYGYRGVRELGLTTHVWAMRPESVIGLLQSYARQEGLDAEAALHGQELRRAQAIGKVEARLGMMPRRKFRGLLKAAHAGIEGRELAKSQWARSTHAIRLMVREIGRRLASRGIIADPEDIFFMRLAELKEAMAGHPVPDLAARIARRRADYERALQVETDERFSGRPVPRLRKDSAAVAESSASGSEGEVLRGIPVSPGRVTAKARVVRELADDVDLEPGEILVCPFTDAAWTPLFFNAAAVVMDLGGPLSHGSTVAREYGLPAVVNVKTGTQRIRDGQTITVDGTKGEVIVTGEG